MKTNLSPWLILSLALLCLLAGRPGNLLAHTHSIEGIVVLFSTLAASYAYSSTLAAEGSPELLYLGVAISTYFAIKNELVVNPEEKGRQAEQELMARAFLHHNRARLQVDLARGQGAHLDTLTVLLGCPPSARGALARLGRESYPRLFPGTGGSAAGLLASLRLEIATDPELAAACRYAMAPSVAALK